MNATILLPMVRPLPPVVNFLVDAQQGKQIIVEILDAPGYSKQIKNKRPHDWNQQQQSVALLRQGNNFAFFMPSPTVV